MTDLNIKVASKNKFGNNNITEYGYIVTFITKNNNLHIAENSRYIYIFPPYNLFLVVCSNPICSF